MVIAGLEVAVVTGDADAVLHRIDLCQEAGHAQRVRQDVGVVPLEEDQDLVPDRNNYVANSKWKPIMKEFISRGK